MLLRKNIRTFGYYDRTITPSDEDEIIIHLSNCILEVRELKFMRVTLETIRTFAVQASNIEVKSGRLSY
jgi:hypothetical protein